MENVAVADWSPDGSALAIARYDLGVRWKIEYPPGKLFCEPPRGGMVLGMRISPDGKSMAIGYGGVPGLPNAIARIDAAGKMRTLLQVAATSGRVAWNSRGNAIWYSAEDGEGGSGLWTIGDSGKPRLALRHAGAVNLQDVSRSGSILVTVAHPENSVMALTPGATRERDLAWLEATSVTDISADGRTLLLNEMGQDRAVYLRKSDGSPAVRLGEGFSSSLSPDGKWAAAWVGGQLVLVPTGPGQLRAVKLPMNGGQA
jgi:hypothetical protein